jgi:uncharacterized protein (DUF983 family)
MSDHGHGSPGKPQTADLWYKLFSIGSISFYVLFLFLITQCRLDFSTNTALFADFLCLVYIVAALVMLGVGVFGALVGMEHARKVKAWYHFYWIILVLYLLGLLAIVSLKIVPNV